MEKASNDPTGTKDSKYSGPEYGPFRCDHCVHFGHDYNTCKHPKVVKDPEMETVRIDGKVYAKVKAGGCCEYFRGSGSMIDVPFAKVGL